MGQIHTSRSSDNKYIDKVWATQNISDGVYKATPDGCWDLIVMIQNDGSKSMMLTGQASKTSIVPYRAGTSSVVISFSAGTYIPKIPGSSMLDMVEVLKNTDAHHFSFLSHIFEIPTYENAEALVNDMHTAKLLAFDDIVASVLAGNPKATSDRNMQRHFMRATGLTRKSLDQIHRAQQAVTLLKTGESPVDTAADTGYADQAHLANSLQKIMQSKPSDIDDIHKL